MPTSGQVIRSIQRFSDYANDLLRSDMNTFEDALNMFITFCESDNVFSIIHNQLQSVLEANFDSWYESRRNTGGGSGSRQLIFPTDQEVRMALMYELLRRIRDERINFLDFTLSFFALDSNAMTAYVQAVNEAITRPLVRELSYRLQDISDHLPKDQGVVVPPATIQIIHQATNVIQQTASGLNISQTATQNINPELCKLFTELQNAIISLEKDKIKLEEYLEIIVSAKELTIIEKPRVSAIKALFSGLPPVASVVSITASILKILGI